MQTHFHSSGSGHDGHTHQIKCTPGRRGAECEICHIPMKVPSPCRHGHIISVFDTPIPQGDPAWCSRCGCLYIPKTGQIIIRGK